MSDSDRTEGDIFLVSGRLRPDVVDEATAQALRESLAHARATNWDSVRTPHLFMGLLAAPDAGVRNWGERLGADLPRLLDQFRELFANCSAITASSVSFAAVTPIRSKHSATMLFGVVNRVMSRSIGVSWSRPESPARA